MGIRRKRPHLALLGGLISCAACSAPPPAAPGPLGIPVWEVSARVESGPHQALSASVPSADAAPQVVRCRMLYLEEVYDEGLESLAAVVEVVADLSGRRPLRLTAEHLADSTWARGEEATAWIRAVEEGAAGRVHVLFDERRALARDSTLWIGASAGEFVEDVTDWLDEFPDRGPIQRRVAVGLSPGARGPVVSLAIDDLDPEVEEELRKDHREHPDRLPGPPGPAYAEAVLREVVQVNVQPTQEAALLFRLPSPFDTGEGSSFAVIVEWLPDSREVLPDLEAPAVAGTEGTDSELSGTDLIAREALRAFRDQTNRSALLLLAERTYAPLTMDIALVARDEFIDMFKRGALTEELPLDASLGWRLEQAAWELLTARAESEELAPELQGLLLRHAGALARFPDVLRRAASASSVSGAFETWLVAEQHLFLAGSNAAARVRAHDWLDARGLAVEGYGPLASSDARRASLDAAERAKEESE